MVITSHSQEETLKIAQDLMVSRNSNVFCLFGDLGAGKTTFVRGAVAALGLRENVQSPTYTFERVYSGKKNTVYHFDFYRLETVDALSSADLVDALEDPKGVVFIEWPEKLTSDVLPIHKTEIHFEHLGDDDRKITVKKMTTEADVVKLIEEFHVPAHVRRHHAAVAGFAVLVGEKLREAGYEVNLELVRHSALLHDIVRVIDFRTFEPEKFVDPYTEKDLHMWRSLRERYAGQHHAAVGAQILEDRGFYAVARVVAKHRYSQIERGFDTWEEKLVYHADKRAKHDKIAPLAERLADGRARNLPGKKETPEEKKAREKVFALEQEIFEAAKITDPEFGLSQNE